MENTSREVFVIVAFRYDSIHSILYKFTYVGEDIPELVAEALSKRKADVISIRRVYEECPKTS